MEWRFLVLVCATILRAVSGIPLSNFYPFNATFGDYTQERGDDVSTDVNQALPEYANSSFLFHGRRASSFFISSNGIITLDTPDFLLFPVQLPIRVSFIAPFWSDVNTNIGGTVYFRDATSDTSLMQRVMAEVRMYFRSGVDYQPTYLFIATWDRVRFTGGSSNLTNTFQCIITSNAEQSYVLFYYADGLIQWANPFFTEDEIPAYPLAGINSGERFEVVTGSRSPAIINVDTTSNVGVGGVWAFRLDTIEVPMVACDDRNALRISPSSGSNLGNAVVLLSGPCFSPDQDIICSFDGSQVRGYYLNELSGYCISPGFERVGWKDLQVTLWPSDGAMNPVYTGSSRFYAGSFRMAAFSNVAIENTADAPNSDRLVSAGVELRVSWNPSLLFPNVDSSTLRVDIILSQFYLTNSVVNRNRTFQVAYLSRSEANDGDALVTLPAIPSSNGQVIAITVQVVLSQSASANLAGAVQRAKLRSRLLYYSPSELNFLGNCQSWVDRQQSGIGEVITSRVAPCPPLLPQANAINSGLREDRASLTAQFRGETTACFTGTDYILGYGQECCYSDSTLVTGSPAGGSVDSISQEVNVWGHIREDIIPYTHCCLGPQSNCLEYYKYRPSDNGARYSPDPPACVYGDPHIITLDGLMYTFNGKGEFVLIQAGENDFSLQGRMVEAIDNQGQPVQATVFSAIAAKERYSSVVQIQLSRDQRTLEMLVDSEQVNFSELSEQQFTNVTVSDRGNNSLSVFFYSGVYVEARASNGFISTLLTSLSERYEEETQGLMGNFNGNSTDDLISRGETLQYSPNVATQREIHSVGVTWIISNEDESLFAYGVNETFSSFYDPSFMPVFTPIFSSPELEQQARTVCNSDQFCLFDVAATGRLEVGLGTAQGNLEYSSIATLTMPASCSPPCVNGVCVSENTCACTSGYQGQTCQDPVRTSCDSNPCSNGGTCFFQAGSYVCTCPQGFMGLRCQFQEPGSSGLMPTDPVFTDDMTTSDSTPTPTCDSMVTDPTFPSMMSGSGIVVDPSCTCTRVIECSNFVRFVDDAKTRVVPTTRNLRCGIGDVNMMTEEMMMGEAAMMGVGSGAMTTPAAPSSQLFIDATFEAATPTLSPGSYLFLREIGFISKIQGLSSCSFQDTSDSSESDSLASYLNLDEATIVYEDGLDQYRRVSVGISQLNDVETLPLQGLDASQQCALLKIAQALRAPVSDQQYSCRSSDNQETVAVFSIPCN